MAEDARLLLLAHESSEVSVISALLQDAIVPAGQLDFDGRARRLTLLASRYRWEVADKTRVRAALRIAGVLNAQRRGWPASPDAMLVLLAIELADEVLTMVFAGGASIRLTVECIDMVLEDLTSPWPATRRPHHE